MHYNAQPVHKMSEKTIAAAAAIQKLKCLQTGGWDEINNSWDPDQNKINNFTINQQAGE